MLQVARLAPKLLGDAVDSVATFLLGQLNPDGGFKDRAGNSDLYYTVFGIEGLFALGAYQYLRFEIPNSEGLLACVGSLKAADGGYANQQDLPMGLTPTTAAAVTVLRQFDRPVDPALGDWLLARCRPDGGFFAT